MSSMQTFVGACLAGDALLSDVDDWVDRWHDASGAPLGYVQDLDEYLGLNDLEYSLWVEKPSALRIIVAARRRRAALSEMQAIAHSALVAARTSDDEEASKLLSWLVETGRISGEDA